MAEVQRNKSQIFVAKNWLITSTVLYTQVVVFELLTCKKLMQELCQYNFDYDMNWKTYSSSPGVGNLFMLEGRINLAVIK
jgi:hypothetical protein